MLADVEDASLASRFRADATDATYDFPEYLFLRSPDDPYVRPTSGPGSNLTIPADPRFDLFVSQAESALSEFVDNASLALTGTVASYLLSKRIDSVRSVLYSWWYDVCAVRAFNRLGRYSRAAIKTFFYGFSPEQFYSLTLGDWVGSTVRTQAQQFLGNGDSSTTGPLAVLLTVDYWEGVLDSVFTQYFEGNGLKEVDPTAPAGEYPFTAFSENEVLFGLRIAHRQTWHLLDYARGELVKTIPLGPRETQKVSMRVLRRRKNIQTSEDASSFETSTEASNSTKDSSEVVNEASRKLNAHVDAEAGVNIFTLVDAKVSVGLALERATSSKSTKSSLNEMMEKTASRMKRDTKVTVSSEQEDTFEDNRSSELTNPNDEVAITYLYSRLQQRYWVSTAIAEVESVVYVPEPLPGWDEIDADWVRAHGEILAGALLDASFEGVLTSLRKEPDGLSPIPTPVFENAAQAGIAAAAAYQKFTGGGRMPDLLASGQQCYERDYERRNAAALDEARRQHQSKALFTHIRRNILHYMRAIWSSEDYDQRMQRYSRMRVPTEWRFVPRAPVPSTAPNSPLEVDGIFVPESSSARPLNEVIDPIGPIGYLFNCAVYRLRDDPRLANMHQALAYLRAAYTRFVLAVTPSAASGVTIRQAVAVAPRRFSADYTILYRANSGKWLILVPGRAEGDWIEVPKPINGYLDVLGLRIWLDGTPADGATLTLTLRSFGELEDPHYRLAKIQHPLPVAADEPALFTDEVLAQMVEVLPELLALGVPNALSWANLSDAQRARFRELYHRFVVLFESGTLVTIETSNLVLDLEIGKAPILEPFKRLHRYLDVMQAHEELKQRRLENRRRSELLKKKILGDPDIEHVTLVGARSNIQDVIALPDDTNE